MKRLYGENANVDGYVMSEQERDAIFQQKIALESEIRRLKAEVARLEGRQEVMKNSIQEWKRMYEKLQETFSVEYEASHRTIVALA